MSVDLVCAASYIDMRSGTGDEELTHEEALNKAFEDGKSRGYEDGLTAGRTEGKEQGKELGRTEGLAEGKVEGGNEAEARLSAQVSALEKLITNTINSETLDAGYLRNLLGQKIAELASERAGRYTPSGR